MANNNISGLGCVLIIIVILVIGFVLNYLEEQTSRMSGLANTLIGAFILGAFWIGFNSKK